MSEGAQRPTSGSSDATEHAVEVMEQAFDKCYYDWLEDEKNTDSFDSSAALRTALAALMEPTRTVCATCGGLGYIPDLKPHPQYEHSPCPAGCTDGYIVGPSALDALVPPIVR